MNYHWYNRQELLEKAKYKYYNHGGKENAAEYYLASKDAIKKQITSKKICLKKKKKQKDNMDKTGTKKERKHKLIL